MGQEQSYSATHGSQHSRQRQRERPREDDSDDKEYRKHHRPRRSTDSVKSDHSSTESSGYRSGSSGYDYRSTSEHSSSHSDYYQTSLYKNDHYKDVNRELYKPIKIPKEKRYKLQFLDVERDTTEYLEKRLSIKSYLSEAEKLRLKAGGVIPPEHAAVKKSGIRNYTPKIISEEEQKEKIKHWI